MRLDCYAESWLGEAEPTLRRLGRKGVRPALDIVVPVHNQERELARAVPRLRSFLRHAFPFWARITIADCASIDSTRDVAAALAAELGGVRLIHLNEEARGRALAAAWMTSDARVVASADADLDIDVSGLPQLIAPLLSATARSRSEAAARRCAET